MRELFVASFRPDEEEEASREVSDWSRGSDIKDWNCLMPSVCFLPTFKRSNHEALLSNVLMTLYRCPFMASGSRSRFSLWTSSCWAPLIKADRDLNTVSLAVQQRHSVWDYHTCGSGINPSRDMGTRDQGGSEGPAQKGRRGELTCQDSAPPPHEVHVVQQVGQVGGTQV